MSNDSLGMDPKQQTIALITGPEAVVEDKGSSMSGRG